MDPIDSKYSEGIAAARDDEASGAQDIERPSQVNAADTASDTISAREHDSLLRQLRRGTLVDGKYRIDRRLGRGSMGIVVEATHVQLDERVALKFLHARIKSTADDFHVRFQREAQMSAKLRGEHVARVIDIGLWQDRYPFMVMDHLSGVDLRSSLKAWGGTLSVDLATEYVVQICEGMAEAHALGIVHCDLKPSNIFITKRPDGSDLIKILDFGISKWSAQEDQTEDVTFTGLVLGSPKYMAPERLFGSSAVDARADVWSIGAICYELLVGRPPFDFSDLRQLYDAIREQSAPPSMREQNPWVTPALEAVVMRCFAHDSERRVASVAELAGALLDAIGEPYANEVQGRLTAVLEGQTSRDSLVGAAGAGASRSSGQFSPGIRSAHAEEHAVARRQAASIPPPLPFALPRTAPSRWSALKALLAQRLQLVALMCAAVLLCGGAFALFSRRANEQARVHVAASRSALPPSGAAPEPAPRDVRPAPRAPAVTSVSPSSGVTAFRARAPALPVFERGRRAQPGEAAQEVPANEKPAVLHGGARLAHGRRVRPAAEGPSATARAPTPGPEQASAVPSTPAASEGLSVTPRAPTARPERVWGLPGATTATGAPSTAPSPASGRAEKVWGLPSAPAAAAPSSSPRAALEDRR